LRGFDGVSATSSLLIRSIHPVTPEQAGLSGFREVRFTSAFLGFADGSAATLTVMHRQEIKSAPSTLEVAATSDRVKFVQGHPEASRFYMTAYLAGVSDADMARAEAHGSQVIVGFLNQVADGER
jgi:hypothetical protein